MTQIARLRNAEIANGNLINADDIAAELNQLVSESNSQDTRLTGLESGAMTISGNKTFSGNLTFSNTVTLNNAVTLSGTISLSGQTNFSRSLDPVSPNNGDFWYNSTGNVFKGQINGNTIQLATQSDLGAYPPGYHGSAAPVYASATTLTLAYIRERESGNGANITKNSGTTVDITTTGVNGLAQSANLAGTISVTSTGTAVTGSGTAFTSTFKVGDVLTTAGNQSRLITAVGNDTSLTVAPAWSSSESTVTYKRGGRAASDVSLSAYYYLYAIAQAAGASPGLLLSTRNMASGDTLVDLPSGYTLASQLALALRLDTSVTPNIVPFQIGMGWPTRPRIDYLVKMGSGNTDTRVLAGGASTTYTAIDCSLFVPSISREAIFAYASNTTGLAGLRQSGNTTHEILFAGTSGGTIGGTDITCGVSATQQIDYKVTNNNISLYVQGFIVTEID